MVIPAYRRSELNNQFNGAPFKAALNEDMAEQYSVEGRLSGDFGPVEWLVGAYYFDEKVEGVNSYNQFATVSFQDFATSTESVAVFGRASFSVTDDLRIVGGIRYTDENRSIDALSIAVTGVCLIEPPFGSPSCPQVPTVPIGLTLMDSLQQLDPALFPAASPLTAPAPYGAFPYGPFGMTGPQALMIISPTPIDRSAGDDEITWRAALEYDVTPDNLLYASFETDQRPGEDDLERDGQEPWNGIRNYQARNLLRDEVAMDDEVFFYHSSCAEPAIAGIAKVVRAAYPDPSQFDPSSPYHDPKSREDKPRWQAVDLIFQQRFAELLPLDSIKSLNGLDGLPLMQRGNRLSVMPVSPEQWRILLHASS